MRGKRLWAPETVQTSAMDCGPACLKSALEGFGIPVSYDRLRDVCQTEVDGTSIDTIEQAANDLGLDAEQVMVPVDHLLIPEAATLPAIVVVRLPNGLTHFVIVWGRLGRHYQIMDPAEGRQWQDAAGFLSRVHVHGQVVAASGWREWAGSPEFLNVLLRRARQLRIAKAAIDEAIGTAMADAGWLKIALLDAVVRMISPIVKGARADGRTATRILEQLLKEAGPAPNPFAVVSPMYWSVLPVASEPGQEQQLAFRGAVVLRMRGRRESQEPLPDHAGGLPADLSSAVRQPQPGALSQLIPFMREDGLLTPTALAMALLLSVGGVFLEALLYRAFIDLPATLGIAGHRLGAVTMLMSFLGVLLMLDLFTVRAVLGIGRRMEVRVRAHLLHALPKLPERYFGSRLVSDMAERSHAIHEIRTIPILGSQLLRSIGALILTLAGIAWLDPQSAWPAIVCAVVAFVPPLAAQPVLAERDLRFRTHSGALCRFYLDALRGLIPTRAHAAEEAIQCEHEELLVTWARSGLARQRAAVALTTAAALANIALIVWLIIGHIARQGESAVMLLLVYWALNVPALCSNIVLLAWQYPKQKNLARRLLDPLRVPGAERNAESDDDVPVHQPLREGVAVSFEDVTVRATGHTILADCTLKLESGSHVCIVGPSGAGKSTFAGLLLGWQSPSTGRILVDGKPLEGAQVEALRTQTAWVDPGVQIWNRSLLENLCYGSAIGEEAVHPGQALEEANLLPLLESLPQGMQTRLGESGSLVSGGEGQRIRLGRALLRNSPRLVILDEPFTNLDRPQRQQFLRRARELWQGATLICITHDVDEALGFDRVLVFDGGRVVEDGMPAELAAREGSRFGDLLLAEMAVREHVWAGGAWRRLRFAQGRILEDTSPERYDQRTQGPVLVGSTVGRGTGGVVPASEARRENGRSGSSDGMAAGQRSRND